MNELRDQSFEELSEEEPEPEPEPFPELSKAGTELSEVSTITPSEDIPVRLEDEKKINSIKDKINFLLTNFDDSFRYGRPRNASDVVSERSRRSNAPSSSIVGYTPEPGSTESISQSGSDVSGLVYDPYSAQAQASPKRPKSFDIADLEKLQGAALDQSLIDIFGFLPRVGESEVPSSRLSQDAILLKDINENTEDIEKFIKNKLNKKKILENNEVDKIRKLVNKLSGTFTRFLNNESLSKINNKMLLDVYNDNPWTINNPYLKKKKLYRKMKENATNYDDIEKAASAAAGKKRISKKQLYDILKNKTTKSTSTIKKLDTDILKILNS